MLSCLRRTNEYAKFVHAHLTNRGRYSKIILEGSIIFTGVSRVSNIIYNNNKCKINKTCGVLFSLKKTRVKLPSTLEMGR